MTQQQSGGGRVQDRDGLNLALQVLSWSDWRERRVVIFELCDVLTARRHTTIEFVVPGRRGGNPPAGPTIRDLPVSFLRKQTYFNFEVTDESGNMVSPLHSRDSARRSAAMLESVGRVAAGKKLPTSVTQHLLTVVGRDADAARDSADKAIAAFDAMQPSGNPNARQRFVRMVRLLAANYLLMVQVDAVPGSRRCINYSYDVEGARGGRRRDRVLTSMGFRPRSVKASMAYIDRVKSIHLEIPAPTEMQVTSATFIEDDARGEATHTELKARFYMSGPDDDQESLTAVAELRPRPKLIVRAGTLTAFLTACFLALGAWRMPEFLGHTSEAAVTIVTLLPALISIVVAGAGEHPFTTANVVGLRILAAIPGLLSVVAASTMLGDFSLCANRVTWIVSSAISLIVGIALAQIWRLCRQS